MDRASQPARTGLTDRLAPDIARINFYRFCQFLEQSQQNAPLGSTDNPATDDHEAFWNFVHFKDIITGHDKG